MILKYNLIIIKYQIVDNFQEYLVISPRNFRPLRRPQRRREGDGGELAVRGRAGGSLRLQGKEEAKMDTHR